VVYRISRFLIRVFLHLLCAFRLEGASHEPTSGPVIIVSNHLSDLDPLVVGASLRRRVGFMAKHELFVNPLVRWWVTSCGAFSVHRGEPDPRALRTALEILRGGGALVMFPEGTRGRDRTLRPPEPGAAMLALRTGATILPLAILGTDKVLPRGARGLRRAPISVRIGPPIPPAAPHLGDGRKPGRDEIDAMGRRYMEAIGRLMTHA
jgi:1-acyl-sn-glycerol-3-phosphate acyltransferase